MYTRSRQSGTNFNQGQRPMNNQTPGQFQGQTTFTSQQGNYQSTPQKTQGNYTGNVQNSQNQFKSQQPQTPTQQPQQQMVKQQQGMVAKPVQQQQKAPATPQQQPQQQQQMMQQIKQSPQQPQTPGTPQPQRLKPILKQTPAPGNVQSPGPQQQQQQQPQTGTPAAAPATQVPANQANSGENIVEGEGGEKMEFDADNQPIRRWKRKAPGLKINRKLKRMRMNQRLRKTLQPKNAIMVLNEMKTGVQFIFPETQSSMNSSLFLVHAEIDGKTYVGQGLSKPLARQNAAENALKSLLLEKMTAASMKARIDAESDGQNQNAGDGNSEGNNDNSDGASMDTSEEADEIPWSSLASFALYRLFLEWQNQGTVVPVPRPGVSPGKIKRDQHKPVVQKDLPPNASTIHPVMLLNQMRPGLTYVESNREGNPPNTIFTLSVEIDGVNYNGTAKNKRDAKKAAAKAALQALYNFSYDDAENAVIKTDNEGDVVMA